MKLKFKLSSVFIVVSLLLALYLITHLLNLTILPVFADEAIYIRWSQLILSDWQQYLFFPLNDGKTPLFIWQLLPFLRFGSDPLFSARLLALIGGILQVAGIVWLVKELKGGRVSQVVAAVLVIFLPFWYMHHRMALMDGWLSVWITFSIAALLYSLRKKSILWAVLSGIFLGASILTKIPALLAVPSLVLLPLLEPLSRKRVRLILIHLGTSLGIGFLSFLALRVSPAFGQLFSRGGDFLFSISDVFHGILIQTLPNMPSYFNYYWQYATGAVVLLFFVSLFLKKNRKMYLLLWLSFLGFYLPVALLGKVVFPRYLLPTLIYITTVVALVIEQLVSKRLPWLTSVVTLLLLATVASSVRFMYYSMANPLETPYVSADREQYLTEWSAGFGTKEIAQRLLSESQAEKIAVATEGSFGSLPDGLLMYLFNQDVHNIAVDGAGLPIDSIPVSLIAKRQKYQRLWLVVNSHRRAFQLPEEALLARYCRPFDAPCLELWDVTDIVDALPASE